MSKHENNYNFRRADQARVVAEAVDTFVARKAVEMKYARGTVAFHSMWRISQSRFWPLAQTASCCPRRRRRINRQEVL